MRPLLIVSFVVTLPLAVSAQGEKKASPDLMLIQGIWKIVSYKRDGKAADEPVGTIAEFSEGMVTITRKNGDKKEAKYTLDPSVTPKQFDLTIERDGESEVAQNIYKLHGDKLTICFSEPGRDLGRPTTFDVDEGDKFELLVLERVKESEE